MLYAIIDIEASGGSPKRDKITEVAIFLYDSEQKKVVDSFTSLINPEVRISPFITRLTGITNKMVSKAPKFAEVAIRIVEITENAVFVAHNVQFDYSYIKTEFKRLGYRYERQKLCTVKLSKRIMPDLPSYNLGGLCRELGISLQKRHRAASDAAATVELFELLLQNDHNQDIEGALANLMVYRNLPPDLPAASLEQLPEETGIYYFYNAQGRVIYVGKSNDIRRRVLEHISNHNDTQNKRWKMVQKTADVSFEETGSELIAQLLESYEIKKLRPAYNRAQRARQFRFGLFKYYDQNGYLRLKIQKKPSGANSNNGHQMITAYHKEEHARNLVWKKIDQHLLCPDMCHQDPSNSKHGCSYFHLDKCNGACIGRESSRQYNRRVEKALEELTYPHPNLLIIGEGRSINEKSVVCVENNHFIGYGYFDPAQVNANDVAQLKSCLDLRQDNPDVNRIILGYLKKSTLDKLVKY